MAVDVHEAVVAAVEAGGWGDCGAWAFMLDEALAPDDVPALLPTLPMPCVDVGPSGRFEIAVRPARPTAGRAGTPGLVCRSTRARRVAPRRDPGPHRPRRPGGDAGGHGRSTR
ncbi:DUF6183 family protein [Streptomyces sp. NPDC051907]|uniref:DUF6183 family protein n=1 Tax=Streptomyces sp. NPDC051907 TaxID=3155284 RepID=UPI0034439EC9